MENLNEENYCLGVIILNPGVLLSLWHIKMLILTQGQIKLHISSLKIWNYSPKKKVHLRLFGNTLKIFWIPLSHFLPTLFLNSDVTLEQLLTWGDFAAPARRGL